MYGFDTIEWRNINPSRRHTLPGPDDVVLIWVGRHWYEGYRQWPCLARLKFMTDGFGEMHPEKWLTISPDWDGGANPKERWTWAGAPVLLTEAVAWAELPKGPDWAEKEREVGEE
jgi:hypothetical protein